MSGSAPLVPWWTTIVLAVLSPVLTLIGVLWTQRTADKRAQSDRETQRQRDRDLWAREDRHRFIEHKRELYSDVLLEIDLVRSGAAWKTFNAMVKGIGISGTLLEDVGATVLESADYTRIHSLHKRLLLVAPENIREVADECINKCRRAESQLAEDNPNLDELTELVNEKVVRDVHELERLMRDDLSPKGEVEEMLRPPPQRRKMWKLAAM